MSYRDEILSTVKQALQVREVPVEGYKKPFYLLDMTGADRDAYEASLAKYRDKDGSVNVLGHSSLIMAEVVARTLVDPSGVRVFSDNEVETVHSTFPRTLLDKLSTFALKTNRAGDEGVKGAAKNS